MTKGSARRGLPPRGHTVHSGRDTFDKSPTLQVRSQGWIPTHLRLASERAAKHAVLDKDQESEGSDEEYHADGDSLTSDNGESAESTIAVLHRGEGYKPRINVNNHATNAFDTYLTIDRPHSSEDEDDDGKEDSEDGREGEGEEGQADCEDYEDDDNDGNVDDSTRKELVDDLNVDETHSNSSTSFAEAVRIVKPNRLSSPDNNKHHEATHPHPTSQFAIRLSLFDDKAWSNCYNFREDIPQFLCTRSKGYPHVLDLERYNFLDQIDHLHAKPMLVDVVITLIYNTDPSAVAKLLHLHGPRFDYYDFSQHYMLWIKRENEKNEIEILYRGSEIRAAKDWNIVLKYSVDFNGQWHPLEGRSDLHGRYARGEDISIEASTTTEVIGMGLARTLMRLLLGNEHGDVRYLYNQPDVSQGLEVMYGETSANDELYLPAYPTDEDYHNSYTSDQADFQQ